MYANGKKQRQAHNMLFDAGSGSSGNPYAKLYDEEAGVLYPGQSNMDASVRNGFLRKVYGVLSVQLLATLAVSTLFMFTNLRDGIVGSPGLQIVLGIAPLILLCPLYAYRNQHPTNLVLLGIWTLGIAVSVGMACTVYSAVVVLEALVLTAAVTTSLTLYTFHANRQGQDMGFLGPMLFSALLMLCLWGFIQIFVPIGPAWHTAYALGGAFVFSGYIIYDTNEMIRRYDVDEWVWAVVNLYLDIINLFLRLLEILQALKGRD